MFYKREHTLTTHKHDGLRRVTLDIYLHKLSVIFFFVTYRNITNLTLLQFVTQVHERKKNFFFQLNFYGYLVPHFLFS